MRIVDFLVEMLSAQASTLQRLAAFFGEEEFLEMLENMGDSPRTAEIVPLRHGPEQLQSRGAIEPPASAAKGSAYGALEGAVREFGLPEFLEFHLWAYPHYRAFIESPLDLNSRITADAGAALIDEAVAQNQSWVKGLHVSPTVWPAAERAAQVPWIRFRAEVLKRMGRRPFAAV